MLRRPPPRSQPAGVVREMQYAPLGRGWKLKLSASGPTSSSESRDGSQAFNSRASASQTPALLAITWYSAARPVLIDVNRACSTSFMRSRWLVDKDAIESLCQVPCESKPWQSASIEGDVDFLPRQVATADHASSPLLRSMQRGESCEGSLTNPSTAYACIWSLG